MSIRNAASCSYIDVNNAVNGGGGFVGQAADGDTVIVPSIGSPATWTTKLAITKNITLLGQTTVDSSTGATNDQTIIIRAFTTQLALITAQTSATAEAAGKKFRLSGFTFRDASTTFSQNGYVAVNGNGHQVRINNNNFDLASTPVQAQAIRVGDNVYGVADHNVIRHLRTQTFGFYNGQIGTDFGSGTWSLPTQWGTDQFFFVENNWIENTSSSEVGMTDGNSGAKFVIRFNKIFNCHLHVHGTEGGVRGGRAIEAYGNETTFSIVDTPGTLRSGCLLFYNNNYHGTAMNNPAYSIDEQREEWCFGKATGSQAITGWQGADGSSPWDVNDTEGDGTYVAATPQKPPHLFFSGTAGAGTTGLGVAPGKPIQVVDNGSPGWTTDKWLGYGMLKVDDGYFSKIIGTVSGNTNLATQTEADKQQVNWQSGSAYQIHRVLTALDQGGRGQADFINGGPYHWLNTVTNSRAWPHQALDPIYTWNNRTVSNGPIGASSRYTILPNRDYFNENNTLVSGRQDTGVGFGTSRPTLGKTGNDITGNATNAGRGMPLNPGTAYFDTSVRTTPGSTGTLYVFTGSTPNSNTGAWVKWYEPYDYPHPLTLGDVAVPRIISPSTASFTEGVGGTLQAASTGFTVAPTWSKTTTGGGESFPASGTTFSGGGLLTVGAGSAAGVYTFTIHAINGSEVDTQSFTLTITAAPTRVIALSGSLAFGDVDINITSPAKSLTITNNGNVILTVTDITLPTGFVATQTSFTIAPGASHLVNITFSATTPGTNNGTCTVVSDKTSGTNTLAVTAFCATRVMGLSGSLDFGSITVGQTATRQLTISNTGNRTLSINSIAYPQGFSGDLLSASIAAGANKILNVTFAPLAAQNYSGSVDITSDKTSGTSSTAATGVGTASATKIIQLTGSLDFGTVQTGTTPTKVLRITNSGDTDLAVSGITYPTGFTGSYSGTIVAGGFHDVTVTFSPVAAISYSGTVTVASDATGGINTTTASGTGQVSATAIIVLSGNLAFGNTVVGSTPTRQFVITNSGNSPLTVSSITLPTGFTGSYAGTLAPGGTASVTVTFSPVLFQAYSGNITVTSDATSGTNTIAASGTGIAQSTRVIDVTGDLAFGNVQKNHSVQRLMTITNTGTGTLSVTNITCPTGFSTDITTASIAPGLSQSVQVTFRPTAVQTYGGTITVASNSTSGVNTILCSGGGTNKRQVPFLLIVG